MHRQVQHGSESGPDEATLIGARTVIPFNGSGDWVCTKPDHWAFAGTGMKAGDRIPGLVGWEHHGNPAPIPGLEVLAAGKTWNGAEQDFFSARVGCQVYQPIYGIDLGSLCLRASASRAERRASSTP